MVCPEEEDPFAMKRPAIFLDRDGVIIRNRSDYVKSVAEVDFLEAATQALCQLAKAPADIVVVTNQSGVGRGLFSLKEAHRINAHVLDFIRGTGGRIDAFYICPHRPDEGCSCRKPAPGLLLRAAEERKLDLKRSVLIGDAESDLLAAKHAGVAGILVLTGRGKEQVSLCDAQLLAKCLVVQDLKVAAPLILKRLGSSG
jgi:D-glycero-D-manno-heptose 1,7-bisphosphate phosphatase